jgi:serine/threonine protein kinase
MTETIGKYQIIRTLGKGATAAVYLAHDPDLRLARSPSS